MRRRNRYSINNRSIDGNYRIRTGLPILFGSSKSSEYIPLYAFNVNEKATRDFCYYPLYLPDTNIVIEPSAAKFKKCFRKAGKIESFMFSGDSVIYNVMKGIIYVIDNNGIKILACASVKSDYALSVIYRRSGSVDSTKMIFFVDYQVFINDKYKKAKYYITNHFLDDADYSRVETTVIKDIRHKLFRDVHIEQKATTMEDNKYLIDRAKSLITSNPLPFVMPEVIPESIMDADNVFIYTNTGNQFEVLKVDSEGILTVNTNGHDALQIENFIRQEAGHMLIHSGEGTINVYGTGGDTVHQYPLTPSDAFTVNTDSVDDNGNRIIWEETGPFPNTDTESQSTTVEEVVQELTHIHNELSIREGELDGLRDAVETTIQELTNTEESNVEENNENISTFDVENETNEENEPEPEYRTYFEGEGEEAVFIIETPESNEELTNTTTAEVATTEERGLARDAMPIIREMQQQIQLSEEDLEDTGEDITF